MDKIGYFVSGYLSGLSVGMIIYYFVDLLLF